MLAVPTEKKRKRKETVIFYVLYCRRTRRYFISFSPSVRRTRGVTRQFVHTLYGRTLWPSLLLLLYCRCRRLAVIGGLKRSGSGTRPWSGEEGRDCQTLYTYISELSIELRINHIIYFQSVLLWLPNI